MKKKQISNLGDIFKNSNLDSFLKTAKQGTGDWWNTFQYPEPPNFNCYNLINCAKSALFGMALSGNFCVIDSFYVIVFDNYSTNNLDKFNKMVKDYVINKLNGKLIYRTGSFYNSFYVFADGALSINISTHSTDTTKLCATLYLVSKNEKCTLFNDLDLEFFHPNE